MSELRVDEIVDELGTGAPDFPNGLTAENIVETSSIRYKENVNPILDSFDIVSKLNGVTYNRINTKKFEAGLIAEDVEKIAPHLVSKNADGSVEGVHYTKLTVYLLEVVKTLMNEIEELKKNNGNP
jgi:hypothetical protein